MLLQHDIDDPLTTIAMLGAASFLEEPLTESEKASLVDRSVQCFQQAREAETHSIAELLLKKLAAVERAKVEPTTDFSNLTRNWYTSPSGLTFVLLPYPETQLNGNSEVETTGAKENQHSSRLAIATTEISLRLYSQWSPKQKPITVAEASNMVPVSKLLMVQMVSFCNWLSEQDGISSDEFCYPPADDMNVAKCQPIANWQTKSGYRLPTVAEWEMASHGSLALAEFPSDSSGYIRHYAWTQLNSDFILHKAGSLLPNRFGLFDLYGNVSEACMDGEQWTPSKPLVYNSMGGSSLHRIQRHWNQLSSPHDPTSRFDFVGMRLVRRLPAVSAKE
jgi:formylglycine-generating enzyme required for sulfatase activity